MATYEKQVEHRQSVEMKTINALIESDQEEMRVTKRGQWFAWIVAMTGIIGALTVILINPTASGAVVSSFIGTGGLGTIVIAFLVRRKDTNEKDSDVKKQK